MRSRILRTIPLGLLLAACVAGQPTPTPDPIQTLVSRLSLDQYKATILGLTQFGDRLQGTERNRQAVDWIEQQLESYGCTNTERIRYEFPSQAPSQRTLGARANPNRVRPRRPPVRGNRRPEGVNSDPNRQPDVALRERNAERTKAGPREEVYCTKIGTTHPDEMYIVSAHMDGLGYGEAANDDGSGTALILELARILNGPDVTTERSIRFALWNNEETGENGALAYIDQRRDRQGVEDPPGSGQYPEPKWLGMIQHDMLLFDHGMPGSDGMVSDYQRLEADVNIEFQAGAAFSTGAAELAWAWQAANEQYATDYPATVGSHMAGTDSIVFQDLVPAISVRELERQAQIEAGWDPTHHQPLDVFSHFSDDDFRLGLNAAQTTLGAVARLAGATLK